MTLPDFFKGRKPQPKPTKVVVQAGGQTITISGEALDALFELAEREQLTVSQVLARAIAVQKAVTEAKAQGRRVVIEQRGDRPRELVTA